MNVTRHEGLKTYLAVAALVVIAGSVLARFDSDTGRWPDLDVAELPAADVPVRSAPLANEPAIVNFWASWCVACREEHPLLIELRSSRAATVFGVNHRDTRENALRWLGYYGDPYERSLFDADGRLAAALGIDVLPVSLVVDAGGRIRYRHIGPLDKHTIDAVILPLLDELRREY